MWRLDRINMNAYSSGFLYAHAASYVLLTKFLELPFNLNVCCLFCFQYRLFTMTYIHFNLLNVPCYATFYPYKNNRRIFVRSKTQYACKDEAKGRRNKVASRKGSKSNSFDYTNGRRRVADVCYDDVTWTIDTGSSHAQIIPLLQNPTWQEWQQKSIFFLVSFLFSLVENWWVKRLPQPERGRKYKFRMLVYYIYKRIRFQQL